MFQTATLSYISIELYPTEVAAPHVKHDIVKKFVFLFPNAARVPISTRLFFSSMLQPAILSPCHYPRKTTKKAIFVKGFGIHRDLTNRSAERSPEKNMKTTVKVGLMTLLAGGFMASSLSVMAAAQLDSWKVRGLTRPGAWFAKNTTEKPVTIGLSKSGQGVGKQKAQDGKKSTHQVGSVKKGS